MRFIALLLTILVVSVHGKSVHHVPDYQRTVVFIYLPTNPGENVFLRGGLSAQARPDCGTVAETDPCAIPIMHRVVPQDPASSYRQWSQGDLHLDWFGAQNGQGAYQARNASGTPLMWTTSTTPGPTDPIVERDGHGYTALNRFGAHYWLLDVDIDCSLTQGGWFEFKTFKTPTPGWEANVAQYSLCAGLPTMPRPYTSINHLAVCGKMNVFYGGENDCNVYPIPEEPYPPAPNTCGQRRMFPDSSPAASVARVNTTRLIVNGDAASLGRWPWQAVLQYSASIGGCAAVLIDTDWAVTAAHCVRGTNPVILTVRMGEQNLVATQGNEQPLRALSIHIHERYGQIPRPGEVDGDYDIALIHLLDPYDRTSYVANTACLPYGYATDAFISDQCFATGFGDTKGTADSYRLNEIQVPVYSHADCVAAWGADNISVRQVCMGTDRLSACGGDSGGPLVCWKDGRWVLVGVTSWGSSTCQNMPSVYTRMTEFLTWIEGITGPIRQH